MNLNDEFDDEDIKSESKSTSKASSQQDTDAIAFLRAKNRVRSFNTFSLFYTLILINFLV